MHEWDKAPTKAELVRYALDHSKPDRGLYPEKLEAAQALKTKLLLAAEQALEAEMDSAQASPLTDRAAFDRVAGYAPGHGPEAEADPDVS